MNSYCGYTFIWGEKIVLIINEFRLYHTSSPNDVDRERDYSCFQTPYTLIIHIPHILRLKLTQEFYRDLELVKTETIVWQIEIFPIEKRKNELVRKYIWNWVGLNFFLKKLNKAYNKVIKYLSLCFIR
jgi:hypothetical protein